jgi:glucose/arabinose dehydrogenase
MRIVILPLAALAVAIGAGLFSELPAHPNGAVDSRAQLVELGHFQQPTYVTAPRGDGRLFVVERTGRIWIVVKGRRLRRPFLDLSRRVTTASIEDGLLSLAFPPDFGASRRLYVDFTSRHRGDSVVLEFHTKKDNRNEVDLDSARTLLHLQNPTHYHHGGLLKFGPDGLLYIGQGDGGRYPDPGLASQRLDSLHGKILRIDPRARDGRAYRVPSNPPLGRPGRDEIYALGFRNPWRFTFNPADGALYVADVGGVRVEELDIVPRSSPRAANYGWPCREGVEVFRTVPFSPPRPDRLCPRAVPPITQTVRAPHPAYPVPLTYSSEVVRPTVVRSGGKAREYFMRGDRACAIVGGVFVQDHRLRRLFGHYLFGDFCTPSVQSLRVSSGNAFKVDALDLSVPALSSFGEDASGHVYLVSLSGPVYRLEPR